MAADRTTMPLLPSSITASLAQTAQAVQSAMRSRAKRELNSTAATRMKDRVDLNIEGVDLEAAVQKLQGNDSERSHQERLGQQDDGRTPSLRRIDVQA